MVLPQRQPSLTASAYLVWEAEQTERYEYVGGVTQARAVSEDRHCSAAGNLCALLHQHLRGSPFRVYTSSIKLHVEQADAYFYPDLFVTCSPRDAADRYIKRDAVLVAEVLSPSTAAYDRGGKFARYRLVSSLQEYVLIDLDARTIDLFRKSADGLWVLHPLQHGDELHLTSVDGRWPVAEVFADLEGEG